MNPVIFYFWRAIPVKAAEWILKFLCWDSADRNQLNDFQKRIIWMFCDRSLSNNKLILPERKLIHLPPRENITNNQCRRSLALHVFFLQTTQTLNFIASYYHFYSRRHIMFRLHVSEQTFSSGGGGGSGDGVKPLPDHFNRQNWDILDNRIF